jgi:hypothetical protein
VFAVLSLNRSIQEGLKRNASKGDSASGPFVLIRCSSS